MATIRKRDLPPDVAKRLGLKAPRRDTEHQEQRALIRWADDPVTRSVYPEIAMLYAIPNFAGRLGQATARHGARLKAEGRRAGVPDLCLPVPRRNWHGLYLEMKAPGGSLTAEQRAWLAALNELGYKAVCVKGCEAARLEIVDYLNCR